MKVLFWLNTFLPDIGGIQTFCADLAPGLMEHGHEILLLTAHTPHPMPDHSMHDRIEVRRVDSLRALVDRDPRDILRCQGEIARVISDFDPDLIHLHPCGPDLVYYLHHRRKHSIPTLLTLHNNFSERNVDFGPESLFGRALAKAEAVTTVSEDSRRWLLSVQPTLDSKTIAIHNGIRSSTAPTVPLPWDPPHLVFVGRIEQQKRLDLIIRAFALILGHHPDARLRIAGNGTQHQDMKHLANSLGCTASVEFLGRVEPEEVPAILDSATVFMMASDFEGLPIAALEAAQRGRPIVSTTAGGMPEVIVDGQTGLLVEPDDHLGLAAATLSLLDDPATASRFGRAARCHVNDAFSLERCVDEYDQLYRSTVGTPTLSPVLT
jgi:glycosyltransferase involved in cell wall biosynthesis